MEPHLLLPDLAHAVTPAGSHGHGVLSMGMAAVVLGAALLAVAGPRLEGRAGGGQSRRISLDLALCVLAGALSLGAAAVHAAVVGVHAAVDPLEGLLFALAAALQAAFGVAVVLSRRPVAALGLGAVNCAAVLAWLWSRTLGLPFGSHAWLPEAIGPLDALATLFELLAVAAAIGVLVALRLSHRGAARLSSALTYLGSAVLVIAAATAVVLTTAYPPEPHGAGHAASAPHH